MNHELSNLATGGKIEQYYGPTQSHMQIVRQPKPRPPQSAIPRMTTAGTSPVAADDVPHASSAAAAVMF
jgi:hypothetical protein